MWHDCNFSDEDSSFELEAYVEFSLAWFSVKPGQGIFMPELDVLSSDLFLMFTWSLPCAIFTEAL